MADAKKAPRQQGGSNPQSLECGCKYFTNCIIVLMYLPVKLQTMVSGKEGADSPERTDNPTTKPKKNKVRYSSD